MKAVWYGGALALLCAASGFTIAALAEYGLLANPIVTASYSANLTGVSSYAGMILAILILLATAAVWSARRTSTEAQSRERKIQSSARRRLFQRLDHELKNPLTIIRLGVANLHQGTNLTPDQSDSIERIDQQTQRLQRLVANLRLLSELEASGIECKPVPIKELLEEAISLSVEAADRHRDISLHMQHAPWPVNAVLGDRDLLVLAFRNLLDNALKFTREGDRVEVRVMEDGRMAVVEVADTGVGIPSEDIPLIFEELYRGQNARGLPGSGLGLRLVQGVLALHEGSIQVRSKPNQGTVFIVRIPLAPEVVNRTV
jgi:two-component system, OmpR family, sensor kinase